MSRHEAHEPDGADASELLARARAIRLVVLDVDGVMTDGGIWLDAEGREIKRFDVRDGSAIVRWRRAGGRVAILSGRRASAVDHRACELGIAPVLQGISEKAPVLHDLINQMEETPASTAYIGDDLPDLPAIAMVGLSACPADAVPAVRDAVDRVTRASGGRGAVREFIDFLLAVREAGPGAGDETGRDPGGFDPEGLAPDGSGPELPCFQEDCLERPGRAPGDDPDSGPDRSTSAPSR